MIGESPTRPDGAAKVTGRALYVDDLRVPGMLHGRTVRSTIARGRIRSITLDPAFDWRGVTVVDHRDIPGENVVQKGYATSPGGEWKLQVDGYAGRPSCVLVGAGAATRYVALAGGSVADGQWHQLTCRRTGTALSIAVDGTVAGVRSVPAALAGPAPGEERTDPRRNRVNPRVIKRKMSKWKKKRPEHRRPEPMKKTFAETVVMLR